MRKNSIQSIINVRENDLLQVEYDNLFHSSNKNTNLYIWAQMNSYARCAMYDHMLSLENAGATIYSVDTDGLFTVFLKIQLTLFLIQIPVITSKTWLKIQRLFLSSQLQFHSWPQKLFDALQGQGLENKKYSYSKAW